MKIKDFRGFRLVLVESQRQVLEDESGIRYEITNDGYCYDLSRGRLPVGKVHPNLGVEPPDFELYESRQDLTDEEKGVFRDKYEDLIYTILRRYHPVGSLEEQKRDQDQFYNDIKYLKRQAETLSRRLDVSLEGLRAQLPEHIEIKLLF